jgi:hypothetical protein
MGVISALRHPFIENVTNLHHKKILCQQYLIFFQWLKWKYILFFVLIKQSINVFGGDIHTILMRPFK